MRRKWYSEAMDHSSNAAAGKGGKPSIHPPSSKGNQQTFHNNLRAQVYRNSGKRSNQRVAREATNTPSKFLPEKESAQLRVVGSVVPPRSSKKGYQLL